ncbi:addiction module protein [Methylomonas fluvii]|uniref:Addiction module protein n=1 Tax=Methylomonas fluvii TaxID=1854564 RepID=A0ABR9DGB9_9GAMM|nr:addiction module protein [Methylomonas fluvii]MBD9362142.1 addiction module protein [Methylomonas fluvii]
MTITELHQLPAIEKLKIIEALWNDLAEDETNLPPPAWHEAELKQTEAGFLSGDIEAVDWLRDKQAEKELHIPK